MLAVGTSTSPQNGNLAKQFNSPNARVALMRAAAGMHIFSSPCGAPMRHTASLPTIAIGAHAQPQSQRPGGLGAWQAEQSTISSKGRLQNDTGPKIGQKGSAMGGRWALRAPAFRRWRQHELEAWGGRGSYPLTLRVGSREWELGDGAQRAED